MHSSHSRARALMYCCTSATTLPAAHALPVSVLTADLPCTLAAVACRTLHVEPFSVHAYVPQETHSGTQQAKSVNLISMLCLSNV